MRRWKLFLSLGLAVIVSIISTGCGGSSTSAPAQLAITHATPPVGRVQTAYSLTLQATGGTAPYSWNTSSGSLPSGLTISAAGVISGTPLATGTSTCGVQVTDSARQIAIAQLSITINPAVLGITTSLLTGGQQHMPYSATLSATGGTPPYAWSTSSGSLPDGLSLSAEGVLSGTPTSGGNSTFTVQDADSESAPQTAHAQLNITVALEGLQITTSFLNSGLTTAPYHASLAATMGEMPYIWSLARGSLPPGLTLNTDGSITGRPTTTGNFPFTVQVSDDESPPQISTAHLSIAVSQRMLVTTEHNDNLRTGQNLNETVLTPSNISSGNFGKLFSQAVDGYVYAQTLYVQQVTIPNKGVHDVLYVATEHDSVYAFDADNNTGQNASPLWQTSFINPPAGITTVSATDVNCDLLAPEIGITGAPVIDADTDTMYVMAETKENGNFVHRLHALDITTGAEKFGGPVVISATYPGNGEGSSGGELTFDPKQQLNRPALLLSNGNIYITWGSNCDITPYHGWVMSYDKSTLQQTGVWVTTPNGGQGGVWMSGGGIAADPAGKIFMATGNGTFDTNGDPSDFGDSLIRMSLGSQGLSLEDYFTPYNQQDLDNRDADVSSAGIMLLPDQVGPHRHELIGVDKLGTIYLVDRDNMGHFNASNNSQIIQCLTGQLATAFTVPTYWKENVYLGGAGFPLVLYTVTNGMLSSQRVSQSPVYFPFPGPANSVSANGTDNGIVWSLETNSHLNNGNDILYAFDATNVANQLYSSTTNDERDDPGGAVKYQIPTAINGKVYIGAIQQVSVYGLLP